MITSVRVIGIEIAMTIAIVIGITPHASWFDNITD